MTKNFPHTLAIQGGGESIKKGKFVKKKFFSDNVECSKKVLKTCEK